MAAARDEVEGEHQQALERAKQRRAGAHAEKRAWRERCVRPSGAPSRVRIPRRTRPDPHARPLLCGRRRRQLFCSRGAPAAEGVEARGGRGGVGTCCTGSGRSRRSDRKAGRSPRQVTSAGAGAVLSLPAARCRRPRCRCRRARCRLVPAPAPSGPTPPPSSASAVSSSRRTGSIGAPTPTSLPCPNCPRCPLRRSAPT